MFSQTITIMKPEIKFNYNANNRFESLGLDKDEFASQLAKIILELSTSDNETHKESMLSEYIHNEMDYKAILFLATSSVMSFMLDSGIAEESE